MVKHALLNESNALGAILQKAAFLASLQALFNRYVEKNTAKHCHVANLSNQRLIVITDSGNWATQLRFQIPDLIKKLREHDILKDLQAICCKTRPAMHDAIKPKTRNMPKLSSSASSALSKNSNDIRDERLKNIMQRIAKHR